LNASSANAEVYNTIILEGSTSSKISKTVPDFTIIDATKWTSTSVGVTSGKAAEIYGMTDGGSSNIIWRGGLIQGSIPLEWDWRKAHDYGGSGVTIFNNGLAEWQFLRVHNAEDGIKSRETPEYSNTASWLVRDCYFTAIRDDSVENDRFEPGTVQDSLFDGVHTFISEQNENVGTNDPIGPNEDNNIYIKRVYVRIYPTNNETGGGKWFKLQGRGIENHKILVSDSVFAVGVKPRSGWSSLDIPTQVTWVGNNNFILWLGAPGTYGGPKPNAVTFLESIEAQNKWTEVRNKWLVNHGLPAQGFPADYNPHFAPIERIPFGLVPANDFIAPSAPTNLSVKEMNF
jgi:hypothetical protein